MTQEAVPLSVNNDDFLRVFFVPSGTNPLSVAALAASTAKGLTYSLTPDGWNPTTNEADVEDPRLSLLQDLSRPGKVTKGLSIQYVYGDTNDVARTVCTPYLTGYLVYRDSIPNATEWATGQKVDVWPIKFGKQVKDPRPANGRQTITQKCYLTGIVQEDQLLVA
jgi:hypothetical protein